MLFVTAQQDSIHHFWHLFLMCHHWTQITQTIQFEWVIEKEKVIFLSDPNQRHASIQSPLQWIFKSVAYALIVHTKHVLAFQRSWGIKFLSGSSCEWSKWIQFRKSHLPLTIERFEMVANIWRALSSGKFWLLLQWICPKSGFSEINITTSNAMVHAWMCNVQPIDLFWNCTWYIKWYIHYKMHRIYYVSLRSCFEAGRMSTDAPTYHNNITSPLLPLKDIASQVVTEIQEK